MLRLLRQAEHDQHPLPYDPKLAGTLDSLQDDSDVDMGVVENGSSDTSSTSDRSSTGLKGLKGAATNIMGRTGHRMHTMADSGRAKVRSLWDRIGERKEEGTAIVTGHRQLDYAGKAEVCCFLISPCEARLNSRTYWTSCIYGTRRSVRRSLTSCHLLRISSIRKEQIVRL